MFVILSEHDLQVLRLSKSVFQTQTFIQSPEIVKLKRQNVKLSFLYLFEDIDIS